MRRNVFFVKTSSIFALIFSRDCVVQRNDLKERNNPKPHVISLQRGHLKPPCTLKKYHLNTTFQLR